MHLTGLTINDSENFFANTMIREPIGDWMELGGVAQQRKGLEVGIENRTATHNDELSKVFFSVD